jgi:hypothetical protein
MKKEIEQALSNSALNYLQHGLRIFHEVRIYSVLNFQPAIGNLCISIELMLKTLIANRCFNLLFIELPIELQAKLNDIKFNNNLYIQKFEENKFKFFDYKTVNIDDSIKIFNSLYANSKHELSSYLRLFKSVRNIALHGAIPSFKKYDLERTAYLSLKIYELLNIDSIFGTNCYKISKEDETFISSFDRLREVRVRNAMQDARKKADRIDFSSHSWIGHDWALLVGECPVCKSAGILVGDTEFSVESDIISDDGTGHLTFVADSFECDECGLKLLDSEELKLVNLETMYDRDNDLDIWIRENYRYDG